MATLDLRVLVFIIIYTRVYVVYKIIKMLWSCTAVTIPPFQYSIPLFIYTPVWNPLLTWTVLFFYNVPFCHIHSVDGLTSDNDTISILGACRLGAPDGNLSITTGIAYRPDPTEQGKFVMKLNGTDNGAHPVLLNCKVTSIIPIR